MWLDHRIRAIVHKVILFALNQNMILFNLIFFSTSDWNAHSIEETHWFQLSIFLKVIKHLPSLIWHTHFMRRCQNWKIIKSFVPIWNHCGWSIEKKVSRLITALRKLPAILGSRALDEFEIHVSKNILSPSHFFVQVSFTYSLRVDHTERDSTYRFSIIGTLYIFC